MVDSADIIKLTERDATILQTHFGRFRISTIEALRRVYWADHTADAAKKWTQRMRAGEYLRAGELGDGREFFYPAHKTVTLAGFPRRYTRPPKGFDLATFYGVLSFCCMGESQYEKMSTDEFHRRFEELCIKPIEQTRYYLDANFTDETHQRKNRIGYVLVDAGARVLQVVTRFRRVIGQRIRVPLWHQWIERDRFLIAVVTCDPHKQRRLQAELSGLRQPVPYRIEVRLDLRDVIPVSIGHAAERQDNP